MIGLLGFAVNFQDEKTRLSRAPADICCVFHHPLVTKVFSSCRFFWRCLSATRYTRTQGTGSVSLPCPAHVRTAL